MTVICPHCGSDHTRRGGQAIWMVYMILLLLAIPAVLVFHLNAGIIAAILVATIIVTHLVFDRRVCLDCGHQWGR